MIGSCSSNSGIQPPLMDCSFTRIAGHDARVQVGSHVPLPDIPRTRCLCSDLSINSFIFTSDEFFAVSALEPSNGKVTSGYILKMFHESIVHGGASQSSNHGKSLCYNLLRHNHTEARGYLSDETK